MELHFAHNRRLDLTVDVDVDDVRVGRVDDLAYIRLIQCEMNGVTVTVNDAGYLTLFAFGFRFFSYRRSYVTNR